MICSATIMESSEEGRILLRHGCHPSVRLCRCEKGEKVLDLGTGTGIIPILLTAKTEEATLPAWRYRKSPRTWPDAWHIIIWKAKVDIVTGDIVEANKLFALASFDVVTTNPYMNESHGLRIGDAKAITP